MGALYHQICNATRIPIWRDITIAAMWCRMSRRVKWFSGAVVLVVLLAVVFSEGLMYSAGTRADAWATRMVDSMVNNQTGVRGYFTLSRMVRIDHLMP